MWHRIGKPGEEAVKSILEKSPECSLACTGGVVPPVWMGVANHCRVYVSWQKSQKCGPQRLSKSRWHNRRKFRSETSDNMDSWKAEVGRVRREKIRREKIRRERVRRKKMQMREKVGKSRNTVFFQWFVAPEGRKVWPDERWKFARRCGAKHTSKSKC